MRRLARSLVACLVVVAAWPAAALAIPTSVTITGSVVDDPDLAPLAASSWVQITGTADDVCSALELVVVDSPTPVAAGKFFANKSTGTWEIVLPQPRLPGFIEYKFHVHCRFALIAGINSDDLSVKVWYTAPPAS